MLKSTSPAFVENTLVVSDFHESFFLKK